MSGYACDDDQSPQAWTTPPMYPQTRRQPGNAITVLTNGSAANSWPSGGFGEPGSVTTVTNAWYSSRYALKVYADDVVSVPPSTIRLGDRVQADRGGAVDGRGVDEVDGAGQLARHHRPLSAFVQDRRIEGDGAVGDPTTTACTMPPGVTPTSPSSSHRRLDRPAPPRRRSAHL